MKENAYRGFCKITLGGKSLAQEVDVCFSQYGGDIKLYDSGYRARQGIVLYAATEKLFFQKKQNCNYSMQGNNLGKYYEEGGHLDGGGAYHEHIISTLSISITQKNNLHIVKLDANCNLLDSVYGEGEREHKGYAKQGNWQILMTLEIPNEQIKIMY